MRTDDARAILAHHARSFAPATRWLPRRDRDRVARLYALCRLLDDMADEDGGHGARARLDRMIDEVSRGAFSDPILTEARDLLGDDATGLRAFGRLIDGVRSDFGPVAITDMADLDRYADAVAGTVGIMVCTLFDIPERHHSQAAALGRAMQITNICRDVLEDARAGRRYLPATLCPFGPDRIVAGDPAASRAVAYAVRHLLHHADGLYAEGRRGYPALPLRLSLAVATAARLYRGIGDRLIALGGDPLSGRICVPRARKLALAGIGLADGAIARRGVRYNDGDAHA